jgi:hypothetical protein
MSTFITKKDYIEEPQDDYVGGVPEKEIEEEDGKEEFDFRFMDISNLF